jgi:molybdenum cofactor cytidylyltransferase
MNSQVVGILLAAGAATRFGGHKLLARLSDGTPIAVAAAQSLAAAVDRAVAVVRPQDRELAGRLAAAGVEPLACAQAGEGMAASLACGVRRAAAAHGWVIALADMPFIRPPTTAAIARRIGAAHPIVAPVYRGRRGHPVGFYREAGAELTTLQGNRGGAELLRRHWGCITWVPVHDPGIHIDIDSPRDLELYGGMSGHHLPAAH